MPLAVAMLKVVLLVDGADRVTVKVADLVPELPSVTLTSAMLSEAASSLTMVPSPWPSPISAPVTCERLTKNVSSGSGVESPLTVKLTVLDVAPAAMLSPDWVLVT